MRAGRRPVANPVSERPQGGGGLTPVDGPKPTFAEFLWIWNALQGLNTPHLHAQMSRWLAERWAAGDRQLLLLAFRNSGKSTLSGLLAAWLLLSNPNVRILTLAADFALARKMVRNVKRIIERHPFTRPLKPARADQWAADQFTVRRDAELRDPSMLAKGIGANITGLHADAIICDDVEVPNTCDTPLKRFDLRERLQEIEYVLVPGGLQLYIGTPHTYYSIYSGETRPEVGEERPFLHQFKRLEVPILDRCGNSRWPERFPLTKIDDIRRRSGANKFESQMLLRPVSVADGRLDPQLLQPYDSDLDYAEGNEEARLSLGGRRLVSASCWWDPSFGSPNAGDASVVAYVFTDDDGDYWLHRVRYLHHDPDRTDEVDEATQMCRQVAQFVSDLYLPAVTLETNGLGRFLPGLLRQVLAASGIVCTVIERSSSRPKHHRILEAFDAVMAAGRLHAHRGVWETPLIQEIREWQPGKKGRDDGLDAVAGCLASEPIRLPRRAPPVRAAAAQSRRWRGASLPRMAAADFVP